VATLALSLFDRGLSKSTGPKKGMDDEFHSRYTTVAVPPATQRLSEVPIDSEIATFVRTASMAFTTNDLAEPQAVVEVDSKREWEICDIIGKEDVDGVVHYLVEWSATLMPKYELKKAKALVDKFEARL
jgi:hypothetical protein